MKKSLLLFVLLCFIVTLFGCGKDEETAATILIGSKNTTEQNILAELARCLIEENTDYKVKIVKDQGYTSKTLLQAAADNDIQLYFDTISSVYRNGIEGETNADISNLQIEVEDILSKEYNLSLCFDAGYASGMVMFINDDSRENLGSPKAITSLSKTAKRLVIGVPESYYNRDDGYKHFQEVYGLTFKDTVVYDNADAAYDDLLAGVIDVYLGETTAIYNSMYDLFLLDDDKGVFGQNEVVGISSQDLNGNYSEAIASLSSLETLLTPGTISGLVEKIEINGYSVKAVVYDYLRSQNII